LAKATDLSAFSHFPYSSGRCINDDPWEATRMGYVLLGFLAATLGGPPDADRQKAVEAVVNRLAELATDRRRPQAVRIEALHILGELGPEAKVALPSLIRQLQTTTDLAVLEETVRTLGQLGGEAQQALPDLTALAGLDVDLDQAIREARQRILTPPEVQNLQELKRMTHSPVAAVRLHAAKAIGARGRSAELLLPDLLQLMRDADADVRRVALEAIRKVQPERLSADDLITSYMMDLSDADESVRLRAIYMLGKLGPTAAPAAKTLQRALRDPSPAVQKAATDALQQILQAPNG
jgi:HEAT repeat protein